MLRIGGLFEAPLNLRPYAVVLHDHGYPILPTYNSLIIELRRDPWTPIDSPVSIVSLSNLVQESLVTFFSIARHPLSPQVIATA